MKDERSSSRLIRIALAIRSLHATASTTPASEKAPIAALPGLLSTTAKVCCVSIVKFISGI